MWILKRVEEICGASQIVNKSDLDNTKKNNKSLKTGTPLGLLLIIVIEGKNKSNWVTTSRKLMGIWWPSLV